MLGIVPEDELEEDEDDHVDTIEVERALLEILPKFKRLTQLHKEMAEEIRDVATILENIAGISADDDEDDV